MVGLVLFMFVIVVFDFVFRSVLWLLLVRFVVVLLFVVVIVVLFRLIEEIGLC